MQLTQTLTMSEKPKLKAMYSWTPTLKPVAPPVVCDRLSDTLLYNLGLCPQTYTVGV